MGRAPSPVHPAIVTCLSISPWARSLPQLGAVARHRSRADAASPTPSPPFLLFGAGGWTYGRRGGGVPRGQLHGLQAGGWAGRGTSFCMQHGPGKYRGGAEETRERGRTITIGMEC
eukprot:scaffold3260_cov212-Isochrysis_galbana.AAC.9